MHVQATVPTKAQEEHAISPQKGREGQGSNQNLLLQGTTLITQIISTSV